MADMTYIALSVKNSHIPNCLNSDGETQTMTVKADEMGE